MNGTPIFLFLFSLQGERGRRPSISSEESLTDCEELGLTHCAGIDDDDQQARARYVTCTVSTIRAIQRHQTVPGVGLLLQRLGKRKDVLFLKSLNSHS